MAVLIKCTRGKGDREAPSIQDTLIFTDAMAKARGKRFLDDPDQGGYYLTKNRTIKVPHKVVGEGASELIVPGKWVSVTDGKLGLQSKSLKIKSYRISLSTSPPSAWGVMETQEFSEFDSGSD